MSKIYGLYDAKYYEQCVYLGTMKEIAGFLGTMDNSLRSCLSHKRDRDKKCLIKNKYEVVEIVDNEDDENEIEIKDRVHKTNKEIFKELINVFTPQKVIFKEFNEFEWQLKRIKR